MNMRGKNVNLLVIQEKREASVKHSPHMPTVTDGYKTIHNINNTCEDVTVESKSY